MSYSNGLLPVKYSIHEPHFKGEKGDPGVGFKLTDDGNYNLENKNVTNVHNGDDDRDVMVKNQIVSYIANKTQYLDGVLPGQVLADKAVIYSPSGSAHSNGLYLKEQYGQEVHVNTENQDNNQIRLYIPNLKRGEDLQ